MNILAYPRVYNSGMVCNKRLKRIVLKTNEPEYENIANFDVICLNYFLCALLKSNSSGRLYRI